MDPVTRADILPLREYEKQRGDIRRRIIELKKTRRVEVGPSLSFVFENRDTVLYQIQEMVRTEQMSDPARIQSEIDVYNELLPRPGELSTTMFIEITDQSRIKESLEAFIGIDRAVRLMAGSAAIPGIFEEGRTRDEGVSSVQYVRFRLSPAERDAARAGGMALSVSHPRYTHLQPLPAPLRDALLLEIS